MIRWTRCVLAILAASLVAASCELLYAPDTSKIPAPCPAAQDRTCPPGLSCTVGGCFDWAGWPMPNPMEITDAGLPNLASYDTSSQRGVVIDKVTGLWWQQPIDADDDEARPMNCAGGCRQADAVEYCAHLKLAGHDDWRLPSRIELVSIIDDARQNPAMNPVFYGAPSAFFWTSSTLAGPTGNAWGVHFDDGSTDTAGVSSALRVRCVR